MPSDEQQIRELVSKWMGATKAGDVETVLALMSDDAVFLVTGQPPMRKADFARLAKGEAAAGAPDVEGESDILEIRILGDWAFMWSHLTVKVTPSGGGDLIVRSGNTLTILRKEGGEWLLARDANMLAPVTQ